jgi:hypothetical protein
MKNLSQLAQGCSVGFEIRNIKKNITRKKAREIFFT